ncbi:Kp4-domain-containing protein [Mycena epipterygia]|nr:Kp4-domain-containing protein [Mycena epipterygia]
MFVIKITFPLLALALSTANGAFAAPANGAAVVTDFGINCEGSSICKGKSAHVASLLVGYIDGIADDAWYNNGQQIACAEDVCAFLQNSGGNSGKNIKGLAHYIRDHGCTACGSVPIFYPGDNNVKDGQLTFNYVSRPACTIGVC